MTNERVKKTDPRPSDIPFYRDETIEDLQRDWLRIIQKKDGFRFSEDAVLLAHGVNRLWDTSRRGACSFVEFGSHCGIVSILFSALSNGARGVGLEISARQVELMQRNILLNGLSDRIAVEQFDIRKLLNPEARLPASLTAGSYHFVIANPPYGLLSDINPSQEANTAITKERLLARYELALSFAQMAKAASRLLKSRGRFVFVHKPERLPELFEALRASQLTPTHLLPIAPMSGVSAKLVLIAATKDAKLGGFHLANELHVRSESGEYSEAVQAMYGAGQKLTKIQLYEGLYDAGEAEIISEPDFPL